ncbi:hypothetical protein [Saccharibacter floricola]|uniref:Uncharacterized protein n=1 Tax=Saccharibacter floricola DSM 15669 TaxID=1123227 RepID=A0ABQ0P2C5_9PROT|nr:hypothetical protein [Saccharibacter floricola]GBQ09071.1 hypothetical protein AA15669_2044 [Saccharibacter floricola DSM 15669]
MIYLHAVPQPQPSVFEQIESADPRTLSDETILSFAQRLSQWVGRMAAASRGAEQEAFNELEYGVETVVQHYTPYMPDPLDRLRQGKTSPVSSIKTRRCWGDVGYDY